MSHASQGDRGSIRAPVGDPNRGALWRNLTPLSITEDNLDPTVWRVSERIHTVLGSICADVSNALPPLRAYNHLDRGTGRQTHSFRNCDPLHIYSYL